MLVARAARINALLRFWELGEEGSHWGFGEPLWEEGLRLSGMDRGLLGRGEAPFPLTQHFGATGRTWSVGLSFQS